MKDEDVRVLKMRVGGKLKGEDMEKKIREVSICGG